jgi:hypothetical protein
MNVALNSSGQLIWECLFPISNDKIFALRKNF